MVDDNSILDRRHVVKKLVDHRGNAKIITGLGSPTYDVFDAGDSHSNFYLWGGMGGTAMIGLGLAMSIPDTPVIVITGDGEQLMGLGSLASIGVQKPNNLAIVVLDNGHFGETGMQKSHTSYGINLCKIAEASKFEFFFDVVSNNDLENLIEILPPVKGPIFANIKIKSQNPPRKLPILDGVELKNRFRKNLGVEPL